MQRHILELTAFSDTVSVSRKEDPAQNIIVRHMATLYTSRHLPQKWEAKFTPINLALFSPDRVSLSGFPASRHHHVLSAKAGEEGLTDNMLSLMGSPKISAFEGLRLIYVCESLFGAM